MIKFEKKRRKTIQKIFLIFLKARKGKRKHAKERKKVIKTFPELFSRQKEAKENLFKNCFNFLCSH